MRVEPFNMSQPDQRIFNLRQLVLGVMNDVADLHIVIHGQWGEESRAPACGQYMIGPGDVIGNGWGRVAAQEQRAGVPDLLQIIEWIVDRQRQMFGSDLIGHIDCFVDRPHDERHGMAGDRL